MPFLRLSRTHSHMEEVLGEGTHVKQAHAKSSLADADIEIPADFYPSGVCTVNKKVSHRL